MFAPCPNVKTSRTDSTYFFVSETEHKFKQQCVYVWQISDV